MDWWRNSLSVTIKGFHHALKSIDDFEYDHVRYVLSRVHDHFMGLDRPHKITKEEIHVVNGLCSTDEVPILRSIPRNNFVELTKSRWDGRAMTINEIDDSTVKFASMIIGFQVYHSSRMNNIHVATIHIAYWMIKENVDYDLSEALRSQLVLNLEFIQKDKRLKFKFGQLIVGLFFYFQNFFPYISDV